MVVRRLGRAGFSLLELSVVLVVIAVVLGFGISMGDNAIKAAQRVNVQQRMATIKEALDFYQQTTGYLPCPALITLKPSDPNFGVQVRPAGGFCGAGLIITAQNDAYVGAVPVRSLGLPDSYAGDVWGNKFTYTVGTEAIHNSNNYAGDPAVLHVFYGDRTGVHYEVTMQADGVTPGAGATFVLVSHGPDGRGAYPLNGSTITVPCGADAANDVENCNNDDTFYDTAYNDGSNVAQHFDDYVVWESNILGRAPTTAGTTFTGCAVGACEPWCATCSGTAPNFPSGGQPLFNPSSVVLCKKIISSTSPCVATCLWSGIIASGPAPRVTCP